jgi:TonB family protein
MVVMVTLDRLENIMRTSLLAGGLFLSTMLLNAQASRPGQDANLEARNESASTLEARPAIPSSTDVRYTPDGHRISTGVIEAKLIKQHETGLSVADFYPTDLSTEKMVLHFTVDENGVPQNVKVVKSINPEVDAHVVAAVQQYRYRPAMLDGQAVASDLNLNMNFRTR